MVIPSSPASRYHVRLICGSCGAEIDRTHDIDLATLRRHWTVIVLGAAFGHGCPSCGSSTFGDANIHTELQIYAGEEQVGKEVLKR